jgi:hypothetical protein
MKVIGVYLMFSGLGLWGVALAAVSPWMLPNYKQDLSAFFGILSDSKFGWVAKLGLALFVLGIALMMLGH